MDTLTRALDRLPAPVARPLAAVTRRTRARPLELLAWVTPVVVYELIRKGPQFVSLEKLVLVVVALLVIPLLARRPGPVLAVLMAFLPLQLGLLAWLYHLGVPGSVVRQLGALKEFLGISLLYSAWRELRSKRRRLDAVDKMVLAFLAALLVYLFIPALVSRPMQPLSFSDRLFGFRSDGAFLLAFLAARHAPIDARWRRRAVIAFLGGCSILAGFGLYQWLSPSGFLSFSMNRLGIIDYQIQVFHLTPLQIQQEFQLITGPPLRVGSLLFSPFDFPDLLLVGAGFLLEVITRGRRIAWRLPFLALLGLAVVASNTRADMLGLVAILLIGVVPAPGRPRWNRLRLIAIVAVAGLALFGNVGTTRISSTPGSRYSNHGHWQEVTGGLYAISKNPLGYGLGTAPAAATQSGVATQGAGYISDNSLIQVGLELGLGLFVLFLVLLGYVLWGLTRAARAGPAPGGRLSAATLAGGARLALVGLIVTGQFHHVFQTFSTTWPLWAVAGLGMRDVFLRAPRSARNRPAPVATTPLIPVGPA